MWSRDILTSTLHYRSSPRDARSYISHNTMQMLLSLDPLLISTAFKRDTTFCLKVSSPNWDDSTCNTGEISIYYWRLRRFTNWHEVHNSFVLVLLGNLAKTMHHLNLILTDPNYDVRLFLLLLFSPVFICEAGAVSPHSELPEELTEPFLDLDPLLSAFIHPGSLSTSQAVTVVISRVVKARHTEPDLWVWYGGLDFLS